MDTGRYAPSPTGDLHLGNLRTALVAWLAARASGRRFVLRYEDLDRDAVVEEAYASQRRDLELLGIDFDGPSLRQRDRADAYREVIAELEAAGATYPCWCSRREIREAVAAPNAATMPGAYPGTCRDLGADERRRREESDRPAALRLRTGGETVWFDDTVVGPVQGVVDDFVIRRGDGTPAYNLVVVVDDAHQGVDQVVRADDLVPSTPRHVHLQSRLGLPVPEYLHVPLVLGPGGDRLAKRDGAVTLSDRLAAGETVGEVRATLAASLGLAEPGERPTPGDLIARYDPALLTRTPFVYDPASPNSRVNTASSTGSTGSSSRRASS